MPSSAPYLNFDLLITRAGDRYRALVVDAPGGDADIFFDLPSSLPGFQEMLALTGPRRGLHDTSVQTKPVASLDDMGRLLYETIFQGEVRDVLVASQREAADNATGLRLRLRFHEDAAELATLPWEILYDAGQARFLALSESLPIVRYLSLPRPRPALVTEPPLRILAVLASPEGLEALNLEGEWQVLAEALSPLVDDGKVVLERLASPTPSALQGRLLGDPVHVLHFVGHGVFDEESRQGMLVLADERNQPELMGARALATLLANHTWLRLLYLNACEGALGDDGNVFAGLAQRLVQQGAPAAIAMQAEISDKAGIDLARTFYTALATGRPVDAALTQARVTLAMNSSVEWATPVLFSRAPDNRLFDIRAVLPTPDCPYPGMKPFTEKQKEFFFGRDKEIDDAVNRLAKHPFLAVVGPSGSGKSSLVYAGILPALRASRRFGPGPWTVHTLRPSDVRTGEGKAAPMQALSRLLSGQLSVISHQLSVTSDGVAPAFRPQSPVTNPQSPTLLFIDQFEETFTLADAAEARAFLDSVHGLIGQPNLNILLTVRADFYAEMMAMGDLWEEVQARRLELTPLGEDELWAAIVEPAARVGVEVEDALATALIADARGEAGVLPLVQETLVRLWDKVEDRQLKRSAYRQMSDGGRSGIQVAINDHANDIYHTLPAADRSIARRIFLRLIQFGEGRADTRRQQTVAELRAGGDDPVRFDETLRALVDGRLLTTGGEVGDPNRRVDISHEALIGGWALLQQWIGEKREAESTRRRLEEAAQIWVASGKQGGLLDDYELYEAESWLALADAQELGVSQYLIDLIQVSRQTIEDRTVAEAAARQRELDQQRKLAEEQRLRAEEQETAANILRRRALLLTGVGILAVILAIAATFFGVESNSNANERATAVAVAVTREAEAVTANMTAVAEAERANTEAERANTQAENARAAEATAVAEQQRAEHEAAVARSGQLAALASNNFSNQLDLGLLLAIEANTVADTVLARGSLLDGVQAHPQAITYLHGHTSEVKSVAFSPDGTLLASGAGNYQDVGEIILWDLTEEPPKQITPPLQGHAGPVTDLAFAQDGNMLVSATGFYGSGENEVFIWDLSKDRFNPEPTALQSGWSIAVSKDSKTLAVTGTTGATFWDMSGAEPEQMDLKLKISGRMAFHPSGEMLTSFVNLADVGLWNLASGELTGEPLQAHGFNPFDIAFSPDGSLFASSADDGLVIVWDTEKRQRVGDPIDAEANGVPGIAFSPDGQMLASAHEDGVIYLWDVSSNPIQQIGDPLAVHTDYVNSVAFSPNGKLLVSASSDGSLILWDVSRSKAVENTFLQYNISAVDWNAHGRYIGVTSAGENLYSFEDKRYFLWDMVGETPRQIGDPFAGEISALSSVGDLLVTSHCSAYDSSTRCAESTMTTWDIGGNTPREIRTTVAPHAVPVTVLRLRSDGRMLATAGSDGIILWDVNQGTLQQRDELLTGRLQNVSLLAFNTSGQILISGTDASGPLNRDRFMNLPEGYVTLWEVESGEAIQEPMRGYASVTPDGSVMAVAKCLENDEGDFCSQIEIAIWDISSDVPVQSGTIPASLGPDWNALATSSDGRFLATGSTDSRVMLWEVIEGSLQRLGQPLTGHTQSVNRLAFSPDTRILVSGSQDRTLTLWDVNSGQAIGKPLKAHDRSPITMFFHPDGTYLYTDGCGRQDGPGCFYGEILQWDMNFESWQAKACARANRNLSQTEWDRFVGVNRPYSPTCQEAAIPDSVIANAKEQAVAQVLNGNVISATATVTQLHGLLVQSGQAELHDDLVQALLVPALMEEALRQAGLGAVEEAQQKLDDLAKLDSITLSEQAVQNEILSLAQAIQTSLDASLLDQAVVDLLRIKDLDARFLSASPHVPLVVGLLQSEGDRLAGQGDVEDATSRYDQARQLGLEIDPEAEAKTKAAASYFAQGRGAFDANSYDDALDFFSRAIELNPELTGAYEWRGYTKRDQQDTEGALADFTSAIDLQELGYNYKWVYANRGLMYFRLNNPERAIADYTKTLELDPTYTWAYEQRGYAKLQLGNNEEAIADYTSAINMKETSYNYKWAYTNRGQARMNLDQYEDAIEDFSAAIALDPQYIWAYMRRFESFYALGNSQSAAADLDFVLSLNPESPGIRRELGQGYLQVGNYQAAIDLFNDLVSNPRLSSPDLLRDRSLAYRRLGNTIQAEVDARMAARLYLQRGHRSVTMSKNLPVAIEDFEEALELVPELAFSPTTLAEAIDFSAKAQMFVDSGQAADAAEALEQAIERAAELEDSILNLTLCRTGLEVIETSDNYAPDVDETVGTALENEDATTVEDSVRAVCRWARDLAQPIKIGQSVTGTLLIPVGEVWALSLQEEQVVSIQWTSENEFFPMVTLQGVRTSWDEFTTGQQRVMSSEGVVLFETGLYLVGVQDDSTIDDITITYRLTITEERGVDAQITLGLFYAANEEIERAVNTFDAALELAPEVIPTLSEEKRNRLVDVYADWAAALNGNQDFVEAMLALERAESVAFGVEPVIAEQRLANDWNNVCWEGGLALVPEVVANACDRAVELDPENGWIRDSRALVRGLLGDAAGAIEDYQAFMTWSESGGTHEGPRQLRRPWLEQLQAGADPADVFDEDLIEALRNELYQ